MGRTPGSPTGGNRPAPTVVVSPASAGTRGLPGVSGPRLVLMDPPSSAPAEESALETSSNTITRRAGRNKKSTTTTAGEASSTGYLGGLGSDHSRNLDWAMGLRGVAALGIGSCSGALLVVRRRRPLLSF